MEIRQLKNFVAVAETLSFSKASQRCFISQSAISQQIKLLEEEIGITLFYRDTHSVQLTEDGENFLPYAKDVISSYDNCKEYVGSVHGTLSGILNIGVGSFIEPYIRKAVARMVTQYPEVIVNVVYDKAFYLNRQLREHDIDIAFTMNLAKEKEGIESVKALDFHLCVIMRKDNPLARKEKVTFEDIKNEKVIMPDVGERELQTIRKYIDVPIESIKPSVIVNDAVSALNLTAELGMITFLPCMYVQNHPALCARPIIGLEMPLASNAHWLEGISHKRSAKVFLDIVREISKGQLLCIKNSNHDK